VAANSHVRRHRRFQKENMLFIHFANRFGNTPGHRHELLFVKHGEDGVGDIDDLGIDVYIIQMLQNPAALLFPGNSIPCFY